MLLVSLELKNGLVSFYVSTKQLDIHQQEFWYLPKQKVLISTENQMVKPSLDKQRVFVFTDNRLPFYLKKIETPGLESSFWGFVDPQRPKMYRLSAVIWAPAFSLGPSIWNFLETHWRDIRLENKQLLKVPAARLMDFVFKVYRGDRRCDKSQLPAKRQHMMGRGNKLWFFDIYVPRAKMGSNQISKTAIHLKDKIRKQFRDTIPNYVHDIIIHIADNSSHSQAMYQYVKPFILEKQSRPDLPEF